MMPHGAERDGAVLIMVTAFVGQAVLAEASLSYLGLGMQEPVPAWGLMLQGGAEEYASTAPWIAIFPGVAIVLSVLGVNLYHRRGQRCRRLSGSSLACRSARPWSSAWNASRA